jgi:hypothetical protein
MVPTPIWLLLAGTYGVSGYLKWWLISAGLEPTLEPPMRELGLAVDKLLLLCALCYGAYRAGANHPAWNKGYRDWLKLTPWTPGKRLPLGPIPLIWQDAVSLAGFMGLAFVHRSFHPSLVLVAFAVPYLLITAWSLAISESGRWSLPILAGLPVILLRPVTGWWDAVVIAVLVPFALIGTSKSLRRFPWKAGGRIEDLSTEQTQSDARRWTATAGGMFEALSPVPPKPPTRLWAAAVGSSLAGWWTFVGLQLVWPAVVPGERDARGLVMAFGVVLALCRWMMYVGGHAAPISIRGRIATGRLVIPAYDKILVAPLCIVLAAIAVPETTLRLGLGLPATVGIAFAVLLFLLVKLPPALGQWKLTGYHHLRFFNRAIAAGGPATRTAG